MTKTLIKSKKRVRDHAEVFTPPHIVEAMLDLVKVELERKDIGSRFLEPACGDGNFLDKILKRKLSVVKDMYGKKQDDYERFAFIAVSSIYGVDLLDDNVKRARERLFISLLDEYRSLYQAKIKEEFLQAIKFVLQKNIVQGDATTLKDKKNKPIVFSEWGPMNNVKIKRRDFQFADILSKESMKIGLFEKMENEELGLRPVKQFPPVHFLKITDYE